MTGNWRGIRAGVAVAFVAVGTTACVGGEASEVPELADAAPTGRLVSVEVLEMQPEEFTDYVQIVATVQANQDVVVSAEEAGAVRELLVAKGAFVQAGQPIARIDDRVLRPQAEQGASEAALAQETYERQRRLWEEDGIGSEMAYLRARYAAESAAAGARVLRERLERTVVRAPISGVLDDRFVEVGTLVAPGTPVARVIDVSTVKVAGGVPERYATEIRSGTAVEVFIDGGSEVFNGRVDFVGVSVESSNRTFPVEIRVPSGGGALKPGMIAGVRLARQSLAAAIVVPQESVLRVEDGYIVYVVSEAGGSPTAESRRVVLGPAQGNRVIVDAGLDPGDRVVVVGQNRLAPGDRLQIVEPIAARVR